MIDQSQSPQFEIIRLFAQRLRPKSWLLAVVLATLVGCLGAVFAETSAEVLDSALMQKRLGWMEEALFAADYSKEPMPQRLNRLEETLFGQPTPIKPEELRVEALHQALMARKQALQSGSALPSATVVQKPTTASGVQAGKSPAPLIKSLPNTMPKVHGQSSANPLSTPLNQRTPDFQQTSVVDSDYPVVDALEDKLFHQRYNQEMVSSRLDRLDQQVFGLPQRGALSSRVDNLKAMVLGESSLDGGLDAGPLNQTALPGRQYFPGVPPRTGFPPGNGSLGSLTPATQEPNTTGLAQPDPSGLNQAYTPTVRDYDALPEDEDALDPNAPLTPETEADMARAITKLEQDLLTTEYPADPIPARLSRLEQQVFHREAPPDVSPQQRLERLISVASAEGSQLKPVTTKQKLKTLLPFLPFLILMLL